MSVLLSGAANGAGSWIEVPSPAHAYKHHFYTFFVTGTFDSAAVTFEISNTLLGTVAYDLLDQAGAAVSVTAKQSFNAEFKAPAIRATVAGGSGSEAITVNML